VFGLFLDGMEKPVAQQAPGMGVDIEDTLCQMLLYPDDMVRSLALSGRSMQRQRSARSFFCSDSLMRVVVHITTLSFGNIKVVEFNGWGLPPQGCGMVMRCSGVCGQLLVSGLKLHR
jgi:hypothetical protein